ncbi:MAG: FAD-dependent oxidoreductase [Bacillota bacterium]
MRYVLIGNSAAGVWAAQILRSLDKESEIIMIAQEAVPAYSRCLLPEYLAGLKKKEDLYIRSHDFYKNNNIQTLFGQRVDTVDAYKKEVILQDNNRIAYDKLLIATGASSFFPPVPGLEGNGVFGLRNLEDAQNILDACRNARRIVVVGGGFVGLEAAYALYKRGHEVTVVEKLSQILPQQFDEKAAQILQADMQAEGIRFILGQGIKEVVSPGLWSRLFGDKGKGVILEDGQRLKAEVIIVAAGIRANTDLVKDTGMKITRGIPVNDYMETSIPDIYAAGDVAETRDIVTGEVGLTPIWPNAAAQGQIAAYNMAGQKKAYGGLIGMQNAVEFREVPAIALGITRPSGDAYQVLSDYVPQKNYYKKLVVQDNKLVGMILVGDINQAGFYGAFIKSKKDISPYLQDIMRKDFSYAYASN